MILSSFILFHFFINMFSIFVLFSCVAFANSYPLENHPLLSHFYNDNGDKTNPDISPIVRLPDNINPLHYTLKINPDLDRSTFKGVVDITISVVESTKEIQLFSEGLIVQQLEIKKQGILVEGTPKTKKGENGLLTIEMNNPLEEKAEYLLTINYEGVLNDNMEGFYKSSYTVDGIKKWMAVTQFQPNHARKTFPCFDEPRYRTTFEISIARSNDNQKTTSNMPKNSKFRNEDGKIWDDYPITMPMPTYLVAFTISEFYTTHTNNDNEKVNIWVRENANKYTNYALSQGRKLLTTLESLIGTTYKLPKLDIIAVPDFEIARENWGMTTYDNTTLPTPHFGAKSIFLSNSAEETQILQESHYQGIYNILKILNLDSFSNYRKQAMKELTRYVILDEASSSARHKSIVTQTISHEFSNQWFGNLITPIKWNDIWLNDAFATFYEYAATAKVEPNWNMEENFIIEAMIPALRVDGLHSRALTIPDTSLQSQFKYLFDTVRGAKGASILKMVKQIMLEGSFEKAIKNYLTNGENKEGGQVAPEHLFEALETQAKEDSISIPSTLSMTKILQPWTTNRGYPLISIMRDLNTKKVKIAQTPYKHTTTESSSDQVWAVPITYTTKSSPMFTETKPSLWSTDANEIELPKTVEKEEWVLCNLQYSGYYRVNYDTHTWNLLINQIKENTETIPPVTRAQLIEDSFTLAADDYINYEIPLQFANAMQKDTNILPWIVLLSHLNKLYRKFADTSYKPDLQVFIKNTVYHKILDHVAFNVKETDTPLIKQGRTDIFLTFCDYPSSPCTENAKAEYEKHSKDLGGVHPDLKPIVYCGMLSSSDNPKQEWEDLWSLYEKSDISYDKSVILSAFGCVKNEAILLKTLAKLNDDIIRKQDRKYLINSMSHSSTSVTAALKFLKQKISSSAYHLDDDSSSIIYSIIYSLHPWFQTEKHIKLLKDIESQLNEIIENDSNFIEIRQVIKIAQETATKLTEESEQKAYELAKCIAQVQGTQPPKPPSSDNTSNSVVLIPSCLLVFFASFIMHFKI